MRFFLPVLSPLLALIFPSAARSGGVMPDPSAEAPTQTVIFVHGIFDFSKCFSRYRRLAEERGWQGHFIDMSNANGTATMAELADQVAEFIKEEVPGQTPVHLVGFSMGGVVSKELLRTHPEIRSRVRGLVTLATPHAGSRLAHFLARPGARELRPGSDLLRAHAAFDWDSLHIPILNLWTSPDFVVLPHRNSRWLGQTNVESPVTIHPWLLWNRRDFAQVAALIETKEPGAPRSFPLIARKPAALRAYPASPAATRLP